MKFWNNKEERRTTLQRVQSELMNWPQWKKDYYNRNFAKGRNHLILK